MNSHSCEGWVTVPFVYDTITVKITWFYASHFLRL